MSGAGYARRSDHRGSIGTRAGRTIAVPIVIYGLMPQLRRPAGA
jgi:hypothetical protein